MRRMSRKSYGVGSPLWRRAVLLSVMTAAAVSGFLGLAAEPLGLETLSLRRGGSDGAEAQPGDGGLRLVSGSAEEVAAAALIGDIPEIAEPDPAPDLQEGLNASAGSEPEQDAVPTWNSADLSEPLPVPEVSARTAVVIDVNSGRVLYEKQKDEKAYPASTTKIMTALLAIEQGDLNETVKIAPEAVGVEGSSIYLAPGEELPLRDLVYGLMLRSGNDAAVAIAGKIGGDSQAFVDMMNSRARELGAKNTHFVNPNGLYDDDHYTTAYDMALIARQAMHNPAFREVAGAKSYQAHRGEDKFNTFYNKNKTVYQYEGGNGIKIGYTKASGRTLVASSKKGDLELICVVMGAPNWFQDAYALMDYVYSNYEPVMVAEAQKPLAAVDIQGGDKEQVYVGVRQDVYCPVRKGSRPDLGVACAVNDMGKAPVSRFQEAGLLHIYVDGSYCYSEPLYYLEDIDRDRK